MDYIIDRLHPHDLDVPEKVIEQAARIVRANRETWPDDDWHSLGKDFDLNLFEEVDEQGTAWKRGATIYPVLNGITQTGGRHVHLNVGYILSNSLAT
jgi:hypothetical protein